MTYLWLYCCMGIMMLLLVVFGAGFDDETDLPVLTAILAGALWPLTMIFLLGRALR